MPLLMCPNDNAAMQTVNRSDVQFDICPTCRGVWLDRGELEAASLVIIITNHSLYDYDFIVKHSQFVLDTRNATKNVKDGREKIRKA